VDFRAAHRGIKKGDLICIRHFLQSGGNANLSNHFGWTLLMLAALEGNTAIGRELIQCGAQLDQRNKFADTALSLAAHAGHAGFVELLVQSGASLDGHPFGSSFESYLDWAAQYGVGTPEAIVKIREMTAAKRDPSEDKSAVPSLRSG
jgi:uncharacterized protein